MPVMPCPGDLGHRSGLWQATLPAGPSPGAHWLAVPATDERGRGASEQVPEITGNACFTGFRARWDGKDAS